MSKKVKGLLTKSLFIKPVFWLVLIVSLGGVFRFYNLNWDLKHSFHPDERNILGQTAGIQSGNGYRVQFFAYGQLPVYLYRATGELVSTPAFFQDLFHGNDGLAQWLYWLFLTVIGLAAVWFFSSTNFDIYPFGFSAFLFAALLFFKFFSIFSIWFDALEPVALKGTGFVLITLLALVGSAFLARIMDIEWVGVPLYVAAGLIFLLGITPTILPDAFSHTIGVMSFTLIVALLSFWWAWVSRWGRLVLSFLSIWAFFASLPHGGRQYVGYGEVMIIGRWWAAVFSTLTIGVIFVFVKKVYQNVGMALLASASFAFAVVSIEQTHYCITESFITLMCMVVALSSYTIIRDKGSWSSYLIAGSAFGLAMAAKTSSLFYILIILVAHLVLLAKKTAKDWEKEDRKQSDNRVLFGVLAAGLLMGILGVFAVVGLKLRGVILDLFWFQPGIANGLGLAMLWTLFVIGFGLSVWGIREFKVVRAQIPQWLKLAGTAGVAFLLFCLLSPWSLLDYQGFMASQNYEWHVVSIADACYVLQFKDTLRYLYQLQNLVSVELWWPLGITVVLGMFWVIARFGFAFMSPAKTNYLLPMPFVRGKGYKFSLPDLLLLVWFLAYFGFIGSWNTKFIRYMVPLIPAFCIFGARFLTDIFEWMKSNFSFERFLKPVVLTLVLGSSLFYSIAYMHVYYFPHPWIDSSVWIFDHIPQGSMILKEAWDDGLPTGLDQNMDSRVKGSMGPQNYRQQDITVYELHGYPTDDTQVKKNYYANILQQGDYISIASKKLWYTLTACTPEFKPHGFNIYPVTSRYYRLLWSGLLGYKMVGEFHNFPSVFGWDHPDDMAEESFSVYDHPRVYIFKKVESVSPERILKLLESDDYVKGINRDMMREITPTNVDAFIQARHNYLDQNGLLQRLDTMVSPAAVSITTSSSIPVMEPPVISKDLTRKRNLSDTLTAIATPEVTIEAPKTVPGLPSAQTLRVLKEYSSNPVIETDLSKSYEVEDGFLYQLRAWVTWLLLLIFLGWAALPLTLRIFSSLSSGAYSLSKIFGFLIFSWIVWFFTSAFSSAFKLSIFTVGFCWLALLGLGTVGLFDFFKNQKKIIVLYKKNKHSWLIQETVFILAFIVFTVVRLYCPHVHDPVGEGYNGGGEAGMDFGFLASVVRSETFPPQNMWMAGQPIGYSFYFGHLMMGVLTKTLGLVPAVTYNLGLITLFASIFSCAFGLAFALSGRLISGWIAGFLCAAAGNLAGAKQYLDALHQSFVAGNLGPLLGHTFDYWGPTRVIPNSINEFPFFSVLYGDLHAHTLAMPFAMLLIGIVASVFMSPSQKPFDWTKDWPGLLAAGFLIGSIAFLNTWELPTWMALIGLVLLVRNLSVLNIKVLQKGLGRFCGVIILTFTLLGWFGFVSRDQSAQVLGGKTPYLVFFAGLGFLAAIGLLFTQTYTRVLSKQLMTIAISVFAVLITALVLWAPFLLTFSPQQREILWVTPVLRTSLKDFFTIYGLFISVLLLAFVVVYSKNILKWINQSSRWRGWERLFEQTVNFFEKLTTPQNSVQAMMALGFVSMLAIIGASWMHWPEQPTARLISQLIGSLAAILLILAIYFNERLEFWIAEMFVFLLWVLALVLRVITFYQDVPFTLGLGLFSILWLLAFFYLGLSIKAFKDRRLSFAYLISSLFFFIIATLEVFAMREYLGGDYMRNNSLFKFGINAWTLASIAVGIFAPKVYEFFENLIKVNKKEALWPRTCCFFIAGIFIFVLLRMLLDSFIPSLSTPIIYLANIIFILSLLAWGLLENWFKGTVLKVIVVFTSVFFTLISLFPLLPASGYGTIFSFAQRWSDDFSVNVLFPLALTLVVVVMGYVFLEKRKDMGRQMAFQSWRVLLMVLFIMVSVYPLASTIRKCHGFLDVFRKQWVGYAEPPTLNGLSYIAKANPADAAAIRFLNEKIPGQPCIAEFVGEGYNSWGSRVSIFTGIPALMGWDGHVREWIGARPGADQDISSRFQATEQIFRTTDVNLAKKYLDAYGVRLVMVGTVERNGVPGRKGGYPPEGLAKFSSFLPLIYKNPEVEIYYNPPTNSGI